MTYPGEEPNWFKAFILFAWIMIWLAHESTTYPFRLLAFDQKGLYQVCNVGFGYWLRRKWICCRLKKCLRDFKTKDHLCLFPDLLSFGFVVFKIVFMPPSVGFGLFSLFFFIFIWLKSFNQSQYLSSMFHLDDNEIWNITWSIPVPIFIALSGC